MKTKHTPGPWKIGKGSFIISDSPSPGIPGSDEVDYYGGHLICESVSKSNATLIAAAPDLLQSLIDVMDYWTGHVDYDASWEVAITARNAIAKAKGETL
jgi:hypothetical protein